MLDQIIRKQKEAVGVAEYHFNGTLEANNLSYIQPNPGLELIAKLQLDVLLREQAILDRLEDMKLFCETN